MRRKIESAPGIETQSESTNFVGKVAAGLPLIVGTQRNLEQTPAVEDTHEDPVTAVRAIVLDEAVVVGAHQHAGIPHTIGLVLSQRRFRDSFEHDPTASTVLAPAEFGIVEVVREVAVLDRPAFAADDPQSRLPALRVDVLERDVRDPFGQDRDTFELVAGLILLSDDPGPATVDRDVRRFDHERSIDLVGIKSRVLREVHRE